MATSDSLAVLLAPFGFTELESRLYCELLQRPNLTGYGLARAVGKATANTYQGLANLVRKGAVLEDDGDPRSFRPVPPAELFATLRQVFDHQAKGAESALKQMYSPASEDRLYQLRQVDQAMTRARTLVDTAEKTLLFDLFPEPFERLREALMAAHARGVKVGGLVYGSTCDVPFTCVVAAGAVFVADCWPGQQVSLVGDGSEVMIALFSRDGSAVNHGFWSDSAYLACMHHSGLASELRLSAMKPRADDPLESFGLLSSRPPGLSRLIGGDSEIGTS